MLKHAVKQTNTSKPKPKRRRKPSIKTANDNKKTVLSGLRGREQKRILARAADLEWQANFAQMKLKRWKALDNEQWTFLEDMLQQARAEITELGVSKAVPALS